MKPSVSIRAGVMLLILAFVSAVPAFSQGKGGKTNSVPVNVTIDDTLGNAVRSDGQGPYPDTMGTGSTGFGFTLAGNRQLTLDFTDCEMSCTAPFSNTAIQVGAGTNVVTPVEDELPVGSSISIALWIVFTDPSNGEEWSVRYKGPTETCGTDAGTANAIVTRVSSTRWTLAAPAGSVACLVKITTVKGRSVYTPSGRFRMPFFMTIDAQ